MSLQPYSILGFESGLKKDKKSFLLIDDAFTSLENAYVWRQRVKKREGLKLVGRLRRYFVNRTTDSQGVALTYTSTGATQQTINIFTLFGIDALETQPNLEIDSLPTPFTFTIDPAGANETIIT